MEGNNITQHRRFEYCRTRLKYRQSKQLTAVKVYTVANESRHLLIFGVPKINLTNEVKRMFTKYGQIKQCRVVTEEFSQNANSQNFEIEQFTDIYHIEFSKLEHSRRAKKFLDARNFYGGILHISYAPELETLDDIRHKLYQRKREVKFRIEMNKSKVSV